jgi:plasmid maintenance system antidote protein VapI
MARYIQEFGHDRNGYFNHIDALVSESDNVTKEINFRLNQLKQQKREAKLNSKRKVEMAH